MRIFSEQDSKLKKGVIVLGALAAAAMLFGLAVAAFLPRQAPSPIAKKAKKQQGPVRSTPRSVEGYAAAPAAWSEAPLREEARLGRAMDQSTVRQLVRMLVEAAATENAALKASMIGALGRLPVSPKPVLESELAKAGSPSVRVAIQEALARVR